MEVFRIAKEGFQELDGAGGLFYPGRWHEKGNRVIYTSSYRSLAALEALVHLSKPLLMRNFVLLTIFVPDNAEIRHLPKELLTTGWNTFEFKTELQQFGTCFLKEKKYLLLKVPSAIVGEEYNYIINPLYPLFNECKIVNSKIFTFDNRLK